MFSGQDVTTGDSRLRGPVERNNLVVAVQSGVPDNGILIFNVHIRLTHGAFSHSYDDSLT